MLRRLVYVLSVPLVVCLAIRPGLSASQRSEAEHLIPITTPGGATVHAELADSTEERARGLMFRETLPKDRGMLFTFDEAQAWSFWMKNTRIPLDIIWMDGKKRIVHVEHNVPTCPRTDDGCPQYQPNEKSMYVLELPGGSAEALKLRPGMTLKFQVHHR